MVGIPLFILTLGGQSLKNQSKINNKGAAQYVQNQGDKKWKKIKTLV